MRVDHPRSQRRWIEVALQIADKGQVLLVTQHDECPRAGQRVGMRVKQARAWHRLQITTRGIPGIGGVDLRLDLDQVLRGLARPVSEGCSQISTIP